MYFVERPAEVPSTFPVSFRERFGRQFNAHLTRVCEFFCGKCEIERNTFQRML